MATLQTAETNFTTVDGLKVAYRRFGKRSTFPLLYINHLRGSMDTLDPFLFNTIAKNREVIVYDSFGIGHSEGTVPDSTKVMASIAAKFLTAIEVSVADVIGFSMGGGVAQILGWDYPEVVHKLILAGTQSGSAGLTSIVNEIAAGNSLPNLPKASNYFLSYVLLQGLSVSANALLQLFKLANVLIGSILDQTVTGMLERQRGSELQWGTFVPIYTNLACIELGLQEVKDAPCLWRKDKVLGRSVRKKS